MELKRMTDGMTQIEGEMNFSFKTDENGDVLIVVGAGYRQEFGDAIDSARRAVATEIKEIQEDLARTLQLLRGQHDAQEAVRKAFNVRIEQKRDHLVYLNEFATIGF